MVRIDLLGRWTAVVFLLMATGPFAEAQSTALDQVQAIVIGLHTAQQAHHVDEQLRTLEGVKVSRTDLNTSNLFMLLRTDSPVTRATVEQHLASMGLEVRCWTRNPRSEAPYVPLDPEQCGNLPHQK